MIKNIVFDFGNVLVRWSPLSILQQHFDHAEANSLLQSIFLSEIWLAYNRGKISLADVIEETHQLLAIPHAKIETAIDDIKCSLLPLPGSFDLANTLAQSGYHLYGLTDTSHEFLAYLKEQYHLDKKLRGIVASCEIGYLKPEPEIYQSLLNTYQLNAAETLFLDDLAKNVAGAQALNIHSIQFINAEQCIKELQKFNITLD